jgi:hypothetical protein
MTPEGNFMGSSGIAGEKTSLTNSGAITGAVTMDGLDSTLTNDGAIYGGVTLAAHDTFVSNGIVHGNLTLADLDSVDVSRGEVTGSIIATNKVDDVFTFRGAFGQETIAGFDAGTATDHDAIVFGGGDFGGYAAVKGAMKQVGSDVVIRLDSTDWLTLTNETIAKLVSKDFRFV